MHALHKLANERVVSHALKPELPLCFFFQEMHDKILVVVEKELAFLSDVGQNVASKIQSCPFCNCVATSTFLCLSLEKRYSLEYHILV